MASIKIDFDDRPVLEALNRLIAAGESPSAALKNIGQSMVNSTRERWHREVDPLGRPWAPLKPATLKKKRSGKILQELGMRGGLMGSLNWRLDGDTGVQWGVNKVYAAIHQFGGTVEHAAYGIKKRLRTNAKGELTRQKDHKNLAVFAGPRHKRFREVATTIGAHSVTIPARPYLGVSEDDRGEMLAILNDHLTGAWKA